MRTQNTDEMCFNSSKKMSIAEQLSLLNTDEVLEITPNHVDLEN